MPAEKAQGIVIRTIDFGETSCVVTFFTREFGRVTGLAKGAFRPKGPFEAALDLLNQCRLVFLRKSPGNLDLITEAKLERRFRPPPRHLGHLHAAYYLVELLQEAALEDDRQPVLYDAAVKVLAALSMPGDAGRYLLWFETMLLFALGRLPALTQCLECGEELPRGVRTAFSRLAGGPLCARCRPGKTSMVSLSPGAWDAWSGIAASLEAWVDAADDDAAAEDVNTASSEDVAEEPTGWSGPVASSLAGPSSEQMRAASIRHVVSQETASWETGVWSPGAAVELSQLLQYMLTHTLGKQLRTQRLVAGLFR